MPDIRPATELGIHMLRVGIPAHKLMPSFRFHSMSKPAIVIRGVVIGSRSA
ncbi:hypothetical protein SCE1572_39485 [Sorangium cellulosum So0157-2]|uniref:Uncharacterized protein n=1 Tax=Sorangium cellulosum So0157-2 TaxID=1254432 RepID=S4YB91_SORCE|nr:hypothetical protein SCE1572_39485 [Sorangium cellulosum So0157-2]